MKTAALIATLALAIVVAPLGAGAQQAGKVPRIGWLSPGSVSSGAHYRKAFSEGLRDLGWIEGQNILVEARYAEGEYERLPGLAAELVNLKVKMIVAVTNIATRVAKQATSTIPIVMTVAADPVGQGYISSLRRPGGNITGVTWDPSPDIVGKYVQFLKEVLPGLRRVGGIIDPYPGIHVYREAAKDAARTLGLTIQHAEVRSPNDIEQAFAILTGRGAQAVLVYGSPFILVHLRQIVELAAKHKLPDIYIFRDAVAMNGLMSYGVNPADLHRRVPGYVDKILKGAKPADIPVEQPTKFELVINLKTAKALGLTIPRSMLIQADQLIE